MKPRPPWAGKYDEPILELLEASGVALPPAVVHFNLRWKNVATPADSTVKRRLRKLAEHDYLEKVEQNAGYYAITQKGRDYLAGNLDADELD
ncbi:hypothetical protein [Halomarina oriensis]|uniref:Phage repressor protein n=1 Tax=Halomarina oriensis TaxID=671145 RepID=A0A6B0GE89_9EURY|nr:hypothetical protein [Halomarina oriensis]MWG33132.1 hypothetical protein [Halomarina oriensis]